MPSAGHIEAGEKPIEGAIRETEEELGIETKEEDYKFIGEYKNCKREGFGICYYSNGDRYVGMYKNNKERLVFVFFLC